jgi:hypothetical protein
VPSWTILPNVTIATEGGSREPLSLAGLASDQTLRGDH